MSSNRLHWPDTFLELCSNERYVWDGTTKAPTCPKQTKIIRFWMSGQKNASWCYLTHLYRAAGILHGLEQGLANASMGSIHLTTCFCKVFLKHNHSYLWTFYGCWCTTVVRVQQFPQGPYDHKAWTIYYLALQRKLFANSLAKI